MKRVPKRVPKWAKPLTAAQRKHLKGVDATTLAAVKRTLAAQKETRDGNGPAYREPCWECRAIATKLGLPT